MTTFRIALTLAGAGLLAAVGSFTFPRGHEAWRTVQAADDPVALSELALARTFDAPRAAEEMAAALAANDPELAQSVADLAAERGLPVAPDLLERVRAANAPSRLRNAGAFARGFVTGAPEDGYGLAGTLLGDLFVFGDVRDAVRESSRWAQGGSADATILALSAAGIAVTAGTYATAGLASPARAGLSLAKAASRAGRLRAGLVRAIRMEKPAELVRLAGDVGHIQAKAGTRAALDALRIAETPKDAARLARLAAAKGGKTRAILKVLGRGAITLTTALFDLASLIFFAIANLLGFCAAMKRGAERITVRVLRRRRDRAALRMRALAGAAAAA